MPNEPTISVVVPLYNERDNVRPLVAAIQPVLDRFAEPAECILVDDGSTDGTTDELKSVTAADARFRFIRHARNFGQSAALLTGMRNARGNYILTIDGDLQNDPDDLPKFVELLHDSDCVCGYRVERNDSWVRKMSSRVANRVRNSVLHDGLRDTGCGTKGFRRECVRYLVCFNGAHRFFAAVLRSAGMRVVEVPVHHHARIHGVSKYGIRNRLWRGVFDLIGVIWLTRRLVFPEIDGGS